jgi:hypothetical protein
MAASVISLTCNALYFAAGRLCGVDAQIRDSK